MFHLVAVDLYGETVAMETIPLAYEDTPEYYDTFAGDVLHFIEKYEYPTEKISRNLHRHTGNHLPRWLVRDLRCHHGKYTDAAF